MGKRFLWVAPNLPQVTKNLKDRSALQELKSKWNATMEMICAHQPECVLLYMPSHAENTAYSFECILHIEELLDVNVQLLDNIEHIDDPMFCKGAPRKTVYLWTQREGAPLVEPVPCLLDDKERWMCLNDVDHVAYKDVQMGLLIMEDFMTGILILSKKLEQTLSISPTLLNRLELPSPEIVLVVGQITPAADVLVNIIKELFAQEKVGAVITCESSAELLEELAPDTVPLISIANELDPFSIDLMWREIKRRKHQSHTYVFIGEWKFDASRTKSKLVSYFAKRENTVPQSACVYDTHAWWSLHPGQKPGPMDVRLMLDPVTVFRHFLSNVAESVKLSIGAGATDSDPDYQQPHASCDCEDDSKSDTE